MYTKRPVFGNYSRQCYRTPSARADSPQRQKQSAANLAPLFIPFSFTYKKRPISPPPHSAILQSEQPEPMALELDFMPTCDRDSIVAEMRRIVAITGKNKITTEDFRLLGRVSGKTAA